MNKKSGSDASSARPYRRICPDTETNSSSDSTFTIPATRNVKSRKRAFCQVWLEDPVFQPWLQQVQHNPYKGKCTICDIYITALKSNLQRHAKTQEHVKNMKYGKRSVSGDGRSTDEATSTDEGRNTDAATSMEVGTDSSSDNTLTDLATRTAKERTFLADWLEDPAFQPWLQQVQHDPYKGKCTFCNVYITALKCNLQQHAKSQKHIKNMKYEKRLVPGAGRSTDEATRMDVGSDSSSDNTLTDPATKKAKRQIFLTDWLGEVDFQPWLQQVQHNPYKGKCTFCDIHITAKKCNLQQHAKTERHLNNMKYGKRLVPGEGTKSFADEVKEAEIRVCTDAIENNRPFSSLNHYVKLSQEAYKTPDVLKRISVSAKKMKAISLNVINKSIVEKTIEKVQGKFFSVLIDETPDVSNTKLVCILIRYVHKEQICTDLLDLIRIKEATGDTLYQCFRLSLKKYNLPISNVVGVCVKNATDIVGMRTSLAFRLISANAEICILPCICHTLHLAVRHACECLPEHVEKFLKSLYSYFSQNPERLRVLEGTQQFMSVTKRKVSQPSATRWLALDECIKRVLNQWPVLFAVLEDASAEKDSHAAKKIFLSFNDHFTKAYLEFLDYFLKIFTTWNKLFQSSTVLVHRLLPECKRLLASLAVNFIKCGKLSELSIHTIDIYNEDNLLPLTSIFPGARCKETLSQIANDNSEKNRDIIKFYTNIKKCYQTGYQNIVDKVPFDDTFLKALDFLNPQTAVDIVKRRADQLDPILNRFNSKFDHEVENEWMQLPVTYLGKSKEKIKETNLLQFWHETSSIAINEGEYLYANLSKLAHLCLTLPHSNADVQRYFSTIAQIKTGGRSRLNPETVAAITRIKLDLKNKNEHWNDYKVTDDMLNLFDNSMYNKEEIPEELLGSILVDESTTDNANH